MDRAVREDEMKKFGESTTTSAVEISKKKKKVASLIVHFASLLVNASLLSFLKGSKKRSPDDDGDILKFRAKTEI